MTLVGQHTNAIETNEERGQQANVSALLSVRKGWNVGERETDRRSIIECYRMHTRIVRKTFSRGMLSDVIIRDS
jgi:uncharacterized membrane-anchored protein